MNGNRMIAFVAAFLITVCEARHGVQALAIRGLVQACDGPILEHSSFKSPIGSE
jgi:hypothetical protein